jgi:hypothetical protein
MGGSNAHDGAFVVGNFAFFAVQSKLRSMYQKITLSTFAANPYEVTAPRSAFCDGIQVELRSIGNSTNM